MKTRVCTKCGKIGQHSRRDFYAEVNRKDGLRPECRDCSNEQRRAWKAKNRDRLSKRRREQYAEQTADARWQKKLAQWKKAPYLTRAQTLAHGIRERSQKNQWPIPEAFRTSAFFIEWMQRQPNCECCGVEFDVGRDRKKTKGQKSDRSPSIDRFDTDKPYELDNIRLICWRCNNIKRNYSASDLRMVADWIDCSAPVDFEAWGNEVGKFQREGAA